MSDKNYVCAVCQNASSLKCGRCHNVAYCSKEHQKFDWKEHKKVCTPSTEQCFTITKDEKLGRHLIATRFILEGELIFEEPPLITGPFRDTPPVCLGCYELLNKTNSQECTQCGWPVCSKACENNPMHKPECEITTKFRKEKVSIKTFNINHPSYQCLTVLRCLHQKNCNRRKWERIIKLESHRENIKKSDIYEKDFLSLMKFISRFFNYNEFTEDEILNVYGIIQTNAHVVPFKKPGYISIFDKASIMEHNCRANCSKSFSKDGELIIRAARGIKKGEHISISYTEPLWGLEERQKHLFITKFFSCKCERCTDPTELGTHFNSLKCFQSECKGYFFPIEQASLKFHWFCTACGKIYTAEDLKDLVEEIKGGTLNINESDPESCKDFLFKYERYLHPNHYVMVQAKLALIIHYEENKLNDASDEDLNFLIEITKDLTSLASHLIPAENRLRGILHYRLTHMLHEKTNREIFYGKKHVSEMRETLLICRDLLKKAYSFVKFEPEILEEGKMAILILKGIENVDKILMNS